MKRFSRRNFSQIMINNSLKHELDKLKSIVSKEVLSSWNLSYGDVISFLVNQFMNSRKQEYDLEKKLRKLPPGRKQLDVSRWEDQVTIVVNELDILY